MNTDKKEDRQCDDEGDLLYVCVDGMSADDNLDFVVLSSAERADILKEFETVYDYLEAHPWDACHEIPVTASNIAKLKALTAAMEALRDANAGSSKR